MKFICKTFSRMGVTFHDESNDSKLIDDWLQLCYSNYSLIVRSKTSLGSSREVEHGCGISFVNYLYLVPLIISQSFCATCARANQTGPESIAFFF